jgi:PAS domain S-box-containing protein
MAGQRSTTLDHTLVLAWTLLILLLAVTFAAWNMAARQVRDVMHKRFDVRQGEIVDAIQNQISVFEQILRGGLGVFAASDQITRADWRAYVNALQLPRRFPGAQGIGYAQMLTTPELQDFTRRVRQADDSAFTVTPPGVRDLYAPILYLEPTNDRYRNALGFDMWSEPARRAAMQQARDTASPVISGKVRMVREFGDRDAVGFLMYLPYYGRFGVPRSIEARRRLLEGFVYSPFRMDDFMAGVLTRPLGTIRLQIFSGAGLSPEALMYDSAPEQPLMSEPVPDLTRVSTLEIDGQIWTARFTALPSFRSSFNEWRPGFILLLGAVISFLVFGILRGAAGRRRAETLNTQLGRIIEDSASEVYVFDAETWAFRLVNRGARENLGYTAEELSGMTPADLYSDFDIERFRQLTRSLRMSAPHRQLTWDATLRRKDGTTYPAEIRLQIASNARPLSFIAIVQDITERRRAEEQQQLLMDELNHRVKNTLATVQSLAAQTLRSSGTPGEFAESMKGRLAALAGSHTLLTRTKWQGTSLAELVAQQLAPFGSATREVTISGEEVFLKPTAALAFGMVLHELTINAVKYGALSVPKGRVAVTWVADEDSKLIVSWVESGGPPVQVPARRGFGRRMIEQGLAYELAGKVTLTFAAEGLRARIEVPLGPELGQHRPAPPKQEPERRRAVS